MNGSRQGKQTASGPSAWVRPGIMVFAGMALASAAPSAPPPGAIRTPPVDHEPTHDSELAVLTYNVKGLPWPVAHGRDQALTRIAARLAAMRRAGRQPQIVVLQEAFTPEAKAIGAAAGYRWQVHGPSARPGPGNPDGGTWLFGETQPAMLDSGLAVLSDHPVLGVERRAFREGDCAGFDCLAAKGVLLVTIDLPDTGPVTVVATHFNSRKASGVAFARANAAYARQAAFLGRLLQARKDAPEALILAGDFNRGNRATRIAALDAVIDPERESLVRLARAGLLGGPKKAEFATIQRRGRDMQFATDGRKLQVDPVAAQVPFGLEPDGTMLSDHMGFVVRYRLSSTGEKPLRLASRIR